MSIQSRLAALAEEPSDESSGPFTEFEEESLVSLALDLPEYFQTVADLLNYKLFSRIEVKYIMSYVLDYFSKYNVLPTRALVRNQLLKELTVDEVGWEGVLKIVDRPANPRDLPAIKEVLHSWARKKSFGMLYEEDALQAYARGDFGRLEEIVNKANRVVETSARGFWLYEQVEELFLPDNTPHITTGFSQLDRVLNNGGPSTGEAVCWLAATGVGKCHTLQTKIYEEHLSRIYELELEDGAVRRLAGHRRVETTGGSVRVCDLAQGHNVVALPPGDDRPDRIGPVHPQEIAVRPGRVVPTGDLKQVEFDELKTDWERPRSEKELRPNRVLTPGGWQPVLDFRKVKTGPTVRVRYSSGELLCDPGHKLFRLSSRWHSPGWVNAADAGLYRMAAMPDGFGRTGVHPATDAGPVVVEPGPIADLYDIEIPAPHAYYTSGLISHNSILLCNNAIHQSTIGNNVLLVTFELDVIKTALRCLGALTQVPLNEFVPRKEMDRAIQELVAKQQEKVRARLRKARSSGAGQIYIVELPPDECSVNHIYAEIHQLRRSKGWSPKVVVIDYLELMVGRREADNKDDYTRQKQVANQVRGLARNEKALVFTATQGNRSANDTSEVIDLNKIAESYGKSMSLDYVVSLNQSPEEYANRVIRMFVAKNRNGEKRITVSCRINYNTMHVSELLPNEQPY